MANDVAAYNPIFYANETLVHLRNALGLAGRIHRGYEAERNATFGRGDTVKIKKPSTFTDQDAPGSIMDLDTSELSLVVTQHREVRFKVTDKDLAFTGDAVITDHIVPAAYALANGMDQFLAGKYVDIPYLYDYGTSTDHTLITGSRKILRDNAVPLDDGRLHMMIDSTIEEAFLNSTFFHSQNVAGGAANETLLRGSLGPRLGVEIFANQNTPTHTPGTAVGGGDVAGAVNDAAGVLKGATTVIVDTFTGSETILAGDTFTIAGNSQRYTATATTTLSTGAGTISFSPAAVQAYADDAVVTFTAMTATAHSQQLLFHRNFMALAVVPLPEPTDINVFTATSEDGLSVRARQWTDADNSEQRVALDVLYGAKVLDGNMAVRLWT